MTEHDAEARATAAAAGVDANILRTEDQRRISGMWERTQQVIALAVVIDTLLVVSGLVLLPAMTVANGGTVPEASASAAQAGMIFLASVANLVIGFYFGRTNHQRVGGDSATRSN